MNATLAPMAFTVFSLKPKPTREETIEQINRMVNMSIIPDRRNIPLYHDEDHPVGPVETWSIGPVRGQCHDYAVTKQWHLAAHGIPSQLVECRVGGTQHHAVLLVDGKVLDNLTPIIKTKRQTGYEYRWTELRNGEPVQCGRQQSPDRPDFWIEGEN